MTIEERITELETELNLIRDKEKDIQSVLFESFEEHNEEYFELINKSILIQNELRRLKIKNDGFNYLDPRKHELSEYEPLDESEGEILRAINRDKKIGQQKKRQSFWNKIEKHNLVDRTKVVNEGILLFDDKFYYYIRKNRWRRKGRTKYYNQKFDRFYDQFLKKTETKL